ncbi:hypothetical protein FJTKL_02278 [Diaporthe vaccinii]|uniref:AB hydrolase-1 domain-containing protein n=1 Tax=Diaporthe vaccinii TaxID=105482 RepID=A0ABR4F3I7_9PEZI
MNFSAFAPLSFLLGQFSTVTSTGQTTTLNTDGLSNGIIGASTGGDSVCVSGNIMVPINTTGTKILYTAPQDQVRVTESFVELNQVDSTFAINAVSGGPSVISGSYSIFCRLCLPSDPAKAHKVKTVQLLTHGATLDHTYWDIAPGYSYVDAATAAGYATLSYDQLGVGNSDHPDPIQDVQAASQVAVTHGLVELLRAGKLGGFDFDKVVGVGHSAGSTLTQAITTRYPEGLDAVILSGTSTSAASVALSMAAFNFVNANTDPSPKLRDLPRRIPDAADAFEQQVANKQTNTLGILLTLGGIIAPSTQFTGPVGAVNGENDLVFCGGNCLYPTDQNKAVLAVFYPAASGRSQTYIAAGAGHSIAAHKSGPDSFAHMVGFLQANGL